MAEQGSTDCITSGSDERENNPFDPKNARKRNNSGVGEG
jgi:hypothetical protein